MTIGTYEVSIYCLCGASMKASGVGDLNVPAELQVIFWSIHEGQGHGHADAKEAAKARRRQQRLLVGEEA